MHGFTQELQMVHDSQRSVEIPAVCSGKWFLVFWGGIKSGVTFVSSFPAGLDKLCQKSFWPLRPLPLSGRLIFFLLLRNSIRVA